MCGPAVTIDPGEIADLFRSHRAPVALVRGDGEDLFQELIATPPEMWARIDGAYVLRKGMLKEGAYQQLLLDHSPFAALECSDQRVLAEEKSHDQSLALEERIAWTRSLLTTQVESRKGCYYSCAFCSTSSMPEHRVRPSSPRRLVDEMVYQFGKGVSFFALTDNIAFDIPDWWREFSKLFRKTGISPSVQFGGYGTPKMMDRNEWEPVVQKLYAVGLRSIILGVQAGSPRILRDIIHRPSDDPLRALSVVQRYVPMGINVKIDIIVGHPTETEHDLQETLRWIRALSDAGGEVFVRELQVVPHSVYELHLQHGDYALPERSGLFKRLIEKAAHHSLGDHVYRAKAFARGIPNKYLIDRERGIRYPDPLFSIEELRQDRAALPASDLPALLQERYGLFYDLVLSLKTGVSDVVPPASTHDRKRN